MNHSIPLTKQMSRIIHLLHLLPRGRILPSTVAITWFALFSLARAVVPAPDGGYPNGNTAEGTDALFSLTDGESNTAIGEEALNDKTGGSEKTSVGNRVVDTN